MADIELPKENDAQLVVRMPKALKARIKKVARKHRAKGAISTVARVAIERGLDSLEKEAA